MNVRCGDVDQLMLMPPSVRDWLPEDHLAFFVLDTVAELDLAEFFAAYRTDGRGGSVYDPAMMLAVLLYAYCTGERSSRRVERRLVEDVAYRVVAANQQPDHATIARFRARHQDAIAGLFGQVLGLCVKAGLVDAGVIAIDGTKIAANASFFANREHDALAKELAADAELNESKDSVGSGEVTDAAHAIAKAILDEAAAVDEAEDAEHGDSRGDELPKEWAGGRDRRARIRAALDELESQKARDYEARMAERAKKEAELGHKLRGPQPKKDAARRSKPRRANTTDPHSRIIAQANKGVLQGYNAQAAATTAQIIVAAEVNRDVERSTALLADRCSGGREPRRRRPRRWRWDLRRRRGLLDRCERHHRGRCRSVDRNQEGLVAQGRQTRRRQARGLGQGQPR